MPLNFLKVCQLRDPQTWRAPEREPLVSRLSGTVIYKFTYLGRHHRLMGRLRSFVAEIKFVGMKPTQ